MKELDFLRCFAILAVLAIHVSTNFTRMNTVNTLVAANVIVDEFFHYAVPLFILISGFVLSLKYWEKYDVRSFYHKRLVSVVPPYLIFSLLYIPFYIMLNVYSPSFLGVVYDILTANAAFHLWFFALIVEFYLAYPLIIAAYHYFERRGRAGTFIILCLVIQLSWQGLRMLAETLIQGSKYYTIFDNLSNRVFLALLFYFVLGIYVSRNFARVKAALSHVNARMILSASTVLVLVTSMVWLAGIQVYGKYYAIPPYGFIADVLVQPFLYILIFILLYWLAAYIMGLDNIVSRAALTIGKYSFGIYLVHVFYREIVAMALGLIGISYDSWLFYPLLFLPVLVLSFVSVYLISFLPGSQYIIGYHHPASG